MRLRWCVVTIEQDREELAAIRLMVSEFATNPEIGRKWIGEPPLHEQDQVRAAVSGLGRMMQAPAAGLTTLEGRAPQNISEWATDTTAMMLAGLSRCYGMRCEHATATPRPLIVLLAARVITCLPCMPDLLPFMEALDAGILPNEGARKCDFCLCEADTFYFSRMQFGMYAITGDACIACHQVFRRGMRVQGAQP